MTIFSEKDRNKGYSAIGQEEELKFQRGTRETYVTSLKGPTDELSANLQPQESQIIAPLTSSNELSSQKHSDNALRVAQTGRNNFNSKVESSQQKQKLINVNQLDLIASNAQSSQKSKSQQGIQILPDQIDYLYSKYGKFCEICQCVKPPRTHHCRKCGRCVLGMDHHCRWVANCVGQRNLKQFLLFVFYLGVVCLYTLITYFSAGM